MRVSDSIAIGGVFVLAACGLDVVGTLVPPDEVPAGGAASGPDSGSGPRVELDDGGSSGSGGSNGGGSSGGGSSGGGSSGGGSSGGDGGSSVDDAGDDGAILQPADPCGACRGAVARRLCVEGACVDAHRVFVTSTQHTANIAGATGADAECERLASARNLGGTWRAWLSVSGSSASSRLVHATIPYRLLDGRIVANDWTDLTDGAIRTTIDVDETRQRLTEAREVWTGTSTGGNLFNGGGCVNFSSASNGSFPVAVGVTSSTSADWTYIYLQECNRTDPRLYCFEQ
ncbi:MAG: hypothetical protein KIT84_36310 [Labilithrix sp.]|nr:hypothetical protein [Labilithrix sp.]MCW5816519.1 hypothetical protein [Labilithrix sp.]